MRKGIIVFLIGVFALASLTMQADNVTGASEMTKKEAAAFLQGLLKEKVKTGAESIAEELSPAVMGAYKKMTSVIETSELAASLCWDLIQLGLITDEKKFATEFAQRFSKYIPEVVTGTANLANPMLEWGIGYRLANEADYKTALYELGKNTYSAISNMDIGEKHKAEQAGASIEKFGALMIEIGGSTARQWRDQFEK